MNTPAISPRHAVSAEDARLKLTAWAQSIGWRVLDEAEMRADVRARLLR
jgi:hypothetical protein